MSTRLTRNLLLTMSLLLACNAVGESLTLKSKQTLRNQLRPFRDHQGMLDTSKLPPNL